MYIYYLIRFIHQVKSASNHFCCLPHSNFTTPKTHRKSGMENDIGRHKI